MVTERGLAVLKAIVQDYVDTREPVGSKTIVDRHAFGVSAATIRNDMALLEDEDLIVAPHTSSGRIPTDKGYRLFVDHLAELRPLSAAQRTAISTFLDDPADLDDLLTRTVRLLTQITGQVALVQYPSFARATVTHIELVSLAPNRVLVIVVTDTGRVSQRIVSLPQELDDQATQALKGRMNGLVTGKQVRDASETLDSQRAVFLTTDPVLAAVSAAVAEELDEFRQDKLVMAGAATLARRELDFRGSIHPLLEAIEEQVAIMRLMAEMVADREGLAASIGSENAAFGLAEASVVTGDYAAPGSRARIGLMGPTRMDYPTNLAAVRAVARYLTRLLDEDDTRR